MFRHSNLRPTCPVIEGFEADEVVFAVHQPQYEPLHCLVSKDPEKAVLSRWTLTAEQRQAVAAGADLYLTILTFGHPLQPILLAVGAAE